MTASPRPLAARVPTRRRLLRIGAVLPVALATALAGAAVVQTVSATTTPARAAVSHRPVGHVEHMLRTAGGMRVSGWSFDPDARTSANWVYAWVDGKNVRSGQRANLNRPDIAAQYRGIGAKHGFAWRIPVPEGRHTVCVRAGNLGRGKPTTLRCRTATFDYGPAGAVDSLTASVGALHLSGWAIDGDAWTTPLSVQVSVDGVRSTILANGKRADVARTYPNTGLLHGFTARYAVAQGTHRVCVTAVNLGYGQNTSFGCRSVTLDDSPVAGLNTPTTSNGRLQIRGWAFDRDAAATPLSVSVRVDSGAAATLTANRSRPDVAKAYPGTGTAHGFVTSVNVAEGRHTVCVVAHNIGLGSDRALPCAKVVVDFTPKAALTSSARTATGLTASGWAYDPDTTDPISTQVSLDGRPAAVVTANRKGTPYTGHHFSATLVTTSGRHTVCAVAVNVLWGSRNSGASCTSTTLALSPLGAFESVTRAAGSTNLQVTGWALDPDTTAPLTVTTTVDGVAAPAHTASVARPDIAAKYPTLGRAHGLSAVFPADTGEHRVCLTAVNVGGGANASLGCRIINAVHPVAAAAPRTVKAIAGYGGATVSWAVPVSDGGAPVSAYTVTSSPGNVIVSVPATATSAVVVGLKASTNYTFAVRASNVAGASVAGVSAVARTQAGPPAQRTPAPISTSRYVRNVRGSSPTDLATMRAEGATDAKRNPSGHGYLVLLDIGGQDAADGGVVLSAGVRFVSYGDLVRDVQAYLDGYASAQRASAPVVVAVGTNNDMDVSTATGRTWATTVVNPLVSYAKRHIGMTVAGANDIEPGFRASYSATKRWLTGYLAATKAPFIFNGSADGCAWTTTNRRCNNGWTMAGLHYLAAAAAPTRMLNLPQVYNNTMADQWKYISLTGVVNRLPRINFAGVLTERTACSQAGSCGSLTGRSAWTRLWNDLQSDARLKVSSLPYSTDLRIDG